MSELRGFGAVAGELRRAGGELLAISVDPPSRSAEVVQRFELPFRILADTDRRVVREFGVLHEKGGPHGEDIALPAHFLVARDGRILWRHIATRVQDRPDPKQLVRDIRAQLQNSR